MRSLTLAAAAALIASLHPTSAVETKDPYFEMTPPKGYIFEVTGCAFWSADDTSDGGVLVVGPKCHIGLRKETPEGLNYVCVGSDAFCTDRIRMRSLHGEDPTSEAR